MWTSKAKTQKGELSRDNESQEKSRFERWYKEQEIVQGTIVEISGHTGISQISFYICWLKQAKENFHGTQETKLNKTQTMEKNDGKKTVGNEVETSTQEEKKDSQTTQD